LNKYRNVNGMISLPSNDCDSFFVIVREAVNLIPIYLI